MYECDGGEPQNCREAYLDRHGRKWWAYVLAFLWSPHNYVIKDHIFYDGGFGEGEDHFRCTRCNDIYIRIHGGGP